MRKIPRIAIAILSSALFLTACSTSELGRAEKVVGEYHRLYNEQNYAEIFNTAHEEARRTKSKEALGLALAQSFENYGRFVSSELVYSKIQPIEGKNARQVDLAYKSKFENAVVNETFLIVVEDRTAALHSIGVLSDEELEKIKTK